MAELLRGEPTAHSLNAVTGELGHEDGVCWPRALRVWPGPKEAVPWKSPVTGRRGVGVRRDTEGADFLCRQNLIRPLGGAVAGEQAIHQIVPSGRPG